MKKSIIRDIVESLVVFALIFFMTVWNFISPLDYILKDALYQKPRGIMSDIKIIAIDEKTLSELGRMDTWSRQVYADLINGLNTYDEAKPAVIAFDIQFVGNVDDGDEAFAEAAKESGNVVTGVQYKYSERAYVDENGKKVYPIEFVSEPFDSLKENVSLGFFNIAQDSDSTVRRFYVEEKYNGETTYAFPKAVYDKYCQVMGKEQTEVPTDKSGKTLINYSGKPGDYEALSFVDVLNGKIDYRAFKDSIVIVGAYAPGTQDSFNVPNGGSKQMYGVEVHANIIQSFIQGRFSINANPYMAGMITGFVGALAHFVFKRKKIWINTILLALIIGGQMFVGVKLNNAGTTISLIYLPIVAVLSYIYSIALGYLVERRRRKKVLNAFKKYVAPEIVDELSKQSDFKIKLGGENRDIAVLFVDIRGFTTMSEKLEPEQVVDILNRYLALTTKSIFDNKGTLDKFVGDATMAVFNSPFDLDDYEFRAVKAALAIVEGGEAIKEEFEEKYGQSVGFGVGVNCGPAVVGNVGCDFRMDFTAIGDTVNTAARLEANAKRGQVLISEELYKRLEDRLEVEEVGVIPLKGKSNGIFVYSVLGVKGEKEA